MHRFGVCSCPHQTYRLITLFFLILNQERFFFESESRPNKMHINIQRIISIQLSMRCVQYHEFPDNTRLQKVCFHYYDPDPIPSPDLHLYHFVSGQKNIDWQYLHFCAFQNSLQWQYVSSPLALFLILFSQIYEITLCLNHFYRSLISQATISLQPFRRKNDRSVKSVDGRTRNYAFSMGNLNNQIEQPPIPAHSSPSQPNLFEHST